MKNINLWESKLTNDYIYFNNIEELFNYLTENKKDLNFITKTDYKPGDICENMHDNIALRNNTHITYTDSTHPIAISTTMFYNSYINPTFFEEHKAEFIAYTKKQLEAHFNSRQTIKIPEFIFSNELLAKIISDEKYRNLNYILDEFDKEINLTDEQIKLLKDNHIEFSINHRFKESEEISTKYIIDIYTLSDLKTANNLSFDIPIEEETIDNFKYINENAIIKFDEPLSKKKNEPLYLQSIANILKKLADHNHKYNILINVDNRELLNQTNILKSLPSNINLMIKNDLYDYDLETYQKEEEKLEKLVKPIRDSNLSPLEKYLAVYNIAKQFKPYNENEKDLDKSRYLRYILDDNNEYIVCVGFAKILEELMNRVGIPNKNLSIGIDVSYDNGFTMEEKNLDITGHARNIIKLDDDKYGIHGYYVVDSTWDNVMDKDIYLNSLMTFNRKKEAKRLEKLTNEDLLLDFNGMDDFKEKINYFFKKELTSIFNNIYFETYEMKKVKEIKNKYQKVIDMTNDKNEKVSFAQTMNKEINALYQEEYVRIYRRIFNSIIEILYHTDYEKYEYFYDKYHNKIKEYNISLEQMETIMNEFTYEYANYIIPITNKEVSLDTIMEAAKVVKKEINSFSEEEVNKWYQETKKDNEEKSLTSFPYKYDPNNKTEAYLESVNEDTNNHTR